MAHATSNEPVFKMTTAESLLPCMAVTLSDRQQITMPLVHPQAGLALLLLTHNDAQRVFKTEAKGEDLCAAIAALKAAPASAPEDQRLFLTPHQLLRDIKRAPALRGVNQVQIVIADYLRPDGGFIVGLMSGSYLDDIAAEEASSPAARDAA